MITEGQNNNTLEGFDGWADLATETDFFSQEESNQEVGTDVETVIEQITRDETEENTEDKNKEKDLFDVEEDENINNEDDNNEKFKGNNISVLNTLKEKGFLDYELEEGEELTEELAEELIEDKFEESVEKKVKELLTELPEMAQQLIQFTVKGGNPVDFINNLYSTEVSIT